MTRSNRANSFADAPNKAGRILAVAESATAPLVLPTVEPARGWAVIAAAQANWAVVTVRRRRTVRGVGRAVWVADRAVAAARFKASIVAEARQPVPAVAAALAGAASAAVELPEAAAVAAVVVVVAAVVAGKLGLALGQQ